MRRCKYAIIDNGIFYDCCGKDNNEKICHQKALKIVILDCYEPVEIDPYWKDIIDETNRRLNNE